ncbi:MAG: ASKHA domain-containing protein [Spirochaetales bacterium]|jgi:uncharacterized 2Fe-2S/4Fe-4S cluster protein (DUF4445 family)|nr:ASKHA domain-containing protein [Spirochaetales bacterium]
MPVISFINENINVTVEEGVSILAGARAAGITIESPCNAMGTCGKCKVIIHGQPPENPGAAVLACQTPVSGNIAVLVKDYREENRSLRILAAGSGFSYEKAPFITKHFRGGATQVYGGDKPLGVEEGNTAAACYGVVVDIGTTTIVSVLVDLHTGGELASDSILNPQTVYAQDVLSRIHFASKPEGLETLHRVFIEALRAMLFKMTSRAAADILNIYEVVFSGNTTMIHLACAEDPAPLGRYPYAPAIWGANHIPADTLGISPFGRIYLPPVISAYVGADITSGILASRLDEKKGAAVFIDVGTNGEMVIAKDGTLAAASTAAGPAFEGMNISCGMRANSGAIEAFHIDDDGNFSFTVIGGGTAKGICGSGLLDMCAELVRTGVIGSNGRFVFPEKGNCSDRLKKSFRSKDGKNAFFITDDVYLAQKDIRQIQLAKGAIRCGIEMLLAGLGIDAENVETVEIAGSFGFHLNENSLINIGMIPPRFAGKVRFAGNTSLSGGLAFLLNTAFREKMKALVKRINKIELAADPGFERNFIKYLNF